MSRWTNRGGWLFFVPLLLASCSSVVFVSDYDEVTDQAATELAARTETFLARYAASTNETGTITREGKSYDSEAATFYAEARGAAAAILLRADQKLHNEDEINVVQSLIKQYERLEASHRLGTITPKSAAGLHRTLRSLLNIQLTKKHIGTTTRGNAASSPES